MEFKTAVLNVCLKQSILTSISDKYCGCVVDKLDSSLSLYGLSIRDPILAESEANVIDNYVTSHCSSDVGTSLPSDLTYYVPNLDTISTLFDRISIECVKLSHAMCKLSLGEISINEFDQTRNTQDTILDVLLDRLITNLDRVLTLNSYPFITEYRTFK